MTLPIIAEARAIKSPIEINYIKKAQNINELILRHALKELRTNLTEIKLSQFIVKEFKQHKIKALAFGPIVAFGKSTADIHHEPNKNKLKFGDTIMIDFGATVNSYCSDMTRTFFFGKATNKQLKIYSDVLQAQNLALNKLAAGTKNCRIIDKAARDFLNQKYSVKKFPHGLGHGVGTVIHEWPAFNPSSRDVLKPNMVMTVEPGIYFKNWGGVRIEDMVLITKRGMTNLTKFPKDLKSITLKIK